MGEERRFGWYRGTAALWAAVFAVVGLWFLVAPGVLSSLLNGAASALSLTPGIAVEGGSLWYVLTLSLMSLLTFLAAASARRPADDNLFRALMISKLVSTAGFLVLARGASGWFLCAVADGFVAFTLGFARMHAVDASLEAWGLLLRRYAGRGPFYEVWYGRVAMEGDRAFWFRYTMIDGAVKESATWAILFEEGGAVVRAGKNVRALSDLRFDRELNVFDGPDGSLTEGGASGRAGSLRWKLAFDDRGRTFRHVPLALRLLRLAKSELDSSHLDARFDGWIEADGERYELRGARGMIGHIHGKRQALEWAWTHCNTFENAPDAVFEGLSARVAIAGRPSPPLSSFVLFVDGKRLAFPRLSGIASTPTSWSEGRWTFSATKGRYSVEGEAVVDPGRVALVTYTDTDGSNLWCRNSKLAGLRITLTDLRTGARRELVCRDSAAFEWVNRRPPERVHLE